VGRWGSLLGEGADLDEVRSGEAGVEREEIVAREPAARETVVPETVVPEPVVREPAVPEPEMLLVEKHSRAVRWASRCSMIASSSSPTISRSGAVANPARLTSSGAPSISQKPRHWSAEKAVTPSQPDLVG